MGSVELRHLDSVDQLRASADAWDDLWRRSATTIPTVRAELVALWLEQFAPGTPFHALAVEEQGSHRMLAALPLVERKIGRIVRGGGLTSNYWSPNGELLLDPKADQQAVLDALVDGIEQIGWPLLWFDMVPIDTPHWQALVEVLRRRGLSVDVHPRWQVGQVALKDDTEAYFASRSKSLRRSLRKDARKLREEAPLELCLERTFSPELVEQRLHEVFAIEDRSWKGNAGGSVLRHPGVFEFYRRQACRLADWGDLRVARLIHGEHTIAFELGWVGGDVYHSYKVGYDPEYRNSGPGHLLRERLIRAMAEEDRIHTIDFQGPTNQALNAWSTDTYRIARLVIAQRSIAGRALYAAYRGVRRLVRLSRKMRPW